MITNFLSASAEKFPTKTALIFENLDINYEDFNYKSKSLAVSLLDTDSEVVSLLLPNSIDFCIAYYGILYSGKICHIIPPSISDSNLETQLEITESSTIISNSVFQKKISRVNSNDNPSVFDIESFEYNTNSSSLPLIEPDTKAMILFSAGTTSAPKGVVLSHTNVQSTVNRVSNFLNISNSDIDVICLPLSHSFGLGCLNCIIKCGGTAVLHQNTINMPKILNSIKIFKATSFASTPTTFQNIIDNHKLLFSNSISSIRYLLTNSSPMPIKLVNELCTLTNNAPFGKILMHEIDLHVYSESEQYQTLVEKYLTGSMHYDNMHMK